MATTNHGHPFKLVSHNVQGLNSPMKRSMAFQYYKSLKAFFSRKCTSPQLTTLHFLYHYYPKFYFAKGPRKTVGVAICFSKRVSFSLEKLVGDPDGRYLLVVGRLEGTQVTLIPYYAPNMGQLPFFRKLLYEVAPELKGTVLFGGGDTPMWP